LGTPQKVNLNGLNQCGKLAQELVDALQRQPVGQPLLGTPEGKTAVLYPGVGPEFRRVRDPATLSAVRDRYALPERFLLSLGTLQPGQNGSVTLQVRVNPGVPNNTPINNTAQITSASPVVDPDRRYVYAASPDGMIRKLSATTGGQVRSRGWPGAVFALTVFGMGPGPNLIVGGGFLEAGGAPANRIAKWNGSQWSALGSGIDFRVSALTAFDDGTGPVLYAGGLFTIAGGRPSSNIAAWRCAIPSVWRSPLSGRC